jgi:quercetin dioxygenase-like cupin family protein
VAAVGTDHFDEKTELDELKLSATQTDGRYTIQDELWHPGYIIKPHYHKVHAETFYLISGKFEWTIGGETRLMSAGDLVYIPPKTVHSVRVIGAEDAHVLFIDHRVGMKRAKNASAHSLRNNSHNRRLNACFVS